MVTVQSRCVGIHTQIYKLVVVFWWFKNVCVKLSRA